MATLPNSPSHPIRCGPFKVTRRGLARAAVLAGVHAVILFHILQWKLSGTTVTPVEPSEAATSIESGYVNAGFILFGLLILTTLIFGRFFCGWACHVVAYQDLCAWLLKKIGLRPKPIRSRLLVFIPFYAAFDMFLRPSIEKLLRGGGETTFQAFALSTDNLWERFPGLWITILTIVVDGFIIVWWLGAKGFCTYGCPYGAIFNIADRAAPGRIRVTDACNGCGHCTAACTSNVRVHEEVALYKNVVDAGCMKCLDCVSSCPKDALYFGMGAPGLLSPRPAVKPAKVYDFTWTGEVFLVLLFAVGILTYRNLYAQVPFLLALGASAIFAFSTLAFARMLRSPDFTFQKHVLRTNGKFTKSGAAAVLIYLAFAAFTVESACVQFYTKMGDRCFQIARQSRDGLARDASMEYYQSAEKYGLFGDKNIQHALASIAYNRGSFDEADRRLRTTVELDPHIVSAWIELAEVQLRKGGPTAAKPVLEQALVANPGNAAILEKLKLVNGK
ncbi:MAG: 4Fe-4S binding protein [Planctomycetes bacterium]|nr:4Fe-4S binding protein [Planctomycetota bacterium]